MISRWFSSQPPEPPRPNAPPEPTPPTRSDVPPLPPPRPPESAPRARLSPLQEAVRAISAKGPNPPAAVLMQMCEYWIRNGIVTEKNLRSTLFSLAPKAGTHFIGHLLVETGLIAEDEVLYTLSKICRIPCYNISQYEISQKALSCVTAEQAHALEILPVDRLGKIVTVAVSNPFVDLGFLAQNGVEAKKILSQRADLLASIDIYYPPDMPRPAPSAEAERPAEPAPPPVPPPPAPAPPPPVPARPAAPPVSPTLEAAFRAWSHLDNGVQPVLARKIPPEEIEFYLRPRS